MYWESQLPDNFDPPEGYCVQYFNFRSIEQWIRAKYERKQFAASGNLPDPSTLVFDEVCSNCQN